MHVCGEDLVSNLQTPAHPCWRALQQGCAGVWRFETKEDHGMDMDVVQQTPPKRVEDRAVASFQLFLGGGGAKFF